MCLYIFFNLLGGGLLVGRNPRIACAMRPPQALAHPNRHDVGERLNLDLCPPQKVTAANDTRCRTAGVDDERSIGIVLQHE